MATLMQTVKVDELSKFGFKSNGEYLNWSKHIKDDAKVNVVPGRTFQMELYIADSGKKYVNKVINMVETADVPAKEEYKKHLKLVEKVDKAEASLVKASADLHKSNMEGSAMTRSDWDAKDKRISRQGLLQACLQAVASFSTPENIFENASKLADKGLEYVNRV